MSQSGIDYAALAKKYGAVSSTPPPTSPGGGVDYSAIAKQFGATSSTPAPQSAPTDETALSFAERNRTPVSFGGMFPTPNTPGVARPSVSVPDKSPIDLIGDFAHSRTPYTPEQANELQNRAKRTLQDSVYAYGARSQSSPYVGTEAGKSKLLGSPEQLAEPGSRAHGALESLGNVATVENATQAGALAAGGAFLGPIAPLTTTILTRLAGAGFTAQMATGLYRTSQDYRAAVDRGDTATARELQGRAMVEAPLTALAAWGTYKGPKGMVPEDALASSKAAARMRVLPTSFLTPEEAITRAVKPDNPTFFHNTIKQAGTIQRVQQAADNMGLPTISNAPDAVSAITQAKTDLLHEYSSQLGPDQTLADLHPNKAAELQTQMDGLNQLQQGIEQRYAAEAEKAAARAQKGNSTQREAAQQIATGLGKYALSSAASKVMPFGGPLARGALKTYGVTSGFHDIVEGMQTLKGDKGTGLDTSLQRILSPNPTSAIDNSVQSVADAVRANPNGPTPFPEPQGNTSDLTVTHNAPPRTPIWQNKGIVPGQPPVQMPEPATAPRSPRTLRAMFAGGEQPDLGGLGDVETGVPSTSTQGMTIAAPSQTPPAGAVVPRGGHPEQIVTEGLTKLSKNDLLEAADNVGVETRPGMSHDSLIKKIVGALEPDEMEAFAEALSGRRGAIPPGPRTPRPVANPDLSDVLQASLEAKGKQPRSIQQIFSGQQQEPVAVGDRRQAGNSDLRARFAAMSPEEQTQALLESHQRERTSVKTGLPNYQAFLDSADTMGRTHPHIGFSDVDDFKAVNDALGHDTVDQRVLPALGDTFKDAIAPENGAVHVFHTGGDEFVFRANDPAAVTRVVNRVNEQLKDAIFKIQKPDGSISEVKGLGLSHGTGQTEQLAELDAAKDKQSRKAAGLRTGGRDAAPAPPLQTVGAPDTQGQQALVSDNAQRQSLLAPPSDKSVVPASSLKRGDVGYVNPQDVKLAPQQFQYKQNVNERGVTNQFADNAFNENLAGVVHAYKDPQTGEVFAVNGHHRTDLAQNSNAPRMLVHVLDVATPEEARSLGALQNIAEGQGTATDAAKFFRDSGTTPADLQKMGVSLSASKVEDGLALSKLDPTIFQKVATGQMTEGRGVAIGQATDNPAQQEAIMSLITRAENRGKSVTDATVAELARQVKNAGLHTSENDDLFGSVPRVSSLAFEKAEVSAFIKKQLGQEKRVFGSVANERTAQTLGRVKDQQIKASENAMISQQAAQGLEAYDKLSAYKGPIDTILEKAAQRLAYGENAAKVKAEAYEAIRQEISKTLPGQ